LQSEIDTLPAHQRPTMREMGRRSEAAEHPFRAMRSDDGSPPAPASIIAVSRFEGRPMVLVERRGQRDELSAVCPLAAELGLRPGMAAAHARALVSDLDVRDADADADRAVLDRLALHAAGHWTPFAGVSGVDGLWLDLSGATHLFGGETRFCERLLRFLARLGFSASIAIAGTPGAAHALARYSGRALTLLPNGVEAQALTDLPLASLRLTEGALMTAARFGLERVGDLYAMPRGPLAKRLGLDSVRRLDQARGIVLEPIEPVVVFEEPCTQRQLLEPIVTAEAIEQVIGDLVDDLAAHLRERALGVRALVLTCLRVDAQKQVVALGTAKATRDAKHLKRILVMRIERIEPGLGIEAITLAAPRTETLAPEAIRAVLDTGPRGGDISELVDRLYGRVGEDRLFKIGSAESDVPERATRPLGPLTDPAGWPAWKRPIRMLKHPEPLSNVVALLPDHPPRRFAWRGNTYRVVAGDGPERIHGEWWRNTRERWAVRDYFRVEAANGERFWVFRRGDGVEALTGDLTWHMHGLFG
jgi:protein ImuB